jgi:hypothetical protein
MGFSSFLPSPAETMVLDIQAQGYKIQYNNLRTVLLLKNSTTISNLVMFID